MNHIIKSITAAALVTFMGSCGKESSVRLETVKVETGEITETVTATGTVESVTQVDVGT